MRQAKANIVNGGNALSLPFGVDPFSARNRASLFPVHPAACTIARTLYANVLR